jgi:hypothetical protein
MIEVLVVLWLWGCGWGWGCFSVCGGEVFIQVPQKRRQPHPSVTRLAIDYTLTGPHMISPLTWQSLECTGAGASREELRRTSKDRRLLVDSISTSRQWLSTHFRLSRW